MDKWQELQKYLSSLAVENNRLCERIFNGPAAVIKGLEQLLIDRFADQLFVLTYLELSGDELDNLRMLLQKLFPFCSLRIQFRQSGQFQDLYLSDEAKDYFTVEEHGLKYTVHSGRGQNTGFFADMINGRKAVIDYINQAGDMKVLNLFAYTCSFAVASISAGAVSVDNWDMNKNSLSIGRENIRLNDLDERKSSYFGYDIFKSFSKIKKRGPYGLIIMDPPPMQGKSFSYKKDYPRLISRIPQIIDKGGAVLFCLNAPDCSHQDFLHMIHTNLSGQFADIREIPCPVSYQGRFKERGLKTYLATGYIQEHS
ncbi:MAG: class I SAM-dependent methyltransferase [Spirochaetales bacterium]|nr:class I SAM-dependent methyltransferase [Spirochaetales bacterium]